MSKIMNKKFTLVLSIITFLYILFIWIHSSMSAEVSSAESTSVLSFIDIIFQKLGISLELTEHIIRKSAHFCEFALLGFLVLWVGHTINEKLSGNLIYCSLICLAIAITDEIIQIFPPGRACRVTDVLLDFSGVVTGFIMFIGMCKIYFKIKGEKIDE